MGRHIVAADLFCGAGGTSTGLAQACHEMDADLALYAFNHDKAAIDTHRANHPYAHHFCANLDGVNPRTLIPDRRLNLLGASPECTAHTYAKGNFPVNDQSRATALHVPRWTDAVRVDHLLVENVPQFMDWGPLDDNNKPLKRYIGAQFQAYIKTLRSQNFRIEHRVLNSADYGDPTVRHRLFILGKRGGGKINWPEPTHDIDPDACLFEGKEPWVTAKTCVDLENRGTSIFGRKRPLSPNTLERILAGLPRFGKGLEPFLLQLTHGGRLLDINKPFPTITGANRGEIALVQPFLITLKGTTESHLRTSAKSLDSPIPSLTASGEHMALIQPYLVKYYGTAGAASLDVPLPTVTGKDRFALVSPQLCEQGEGRLGLDILFRMLEPSELARAMGFPLNHIFCGTRTQKVKQIGNAVSVRTARALTHALLS